MPYKDANKGAACKRRYYERNRMLCIKRATSYNKEHPERRAELYQLRRDETIAKVSSYRQANPDKVKRWRRQGNQNRRKMLGKHSYTQWEARASYYGWQCAYCHCEINENNVHRDHVIPAAAGGTNWASNIVPACKRCNHRKHTKRWIPRQPRPHSPLPD